MEKVIIIWLLSLVSGYIFSQPNGGFENWSSEFSYEVPDNWQTLNFLSLSSPSMPLSAFKAIGIDRHSGNYAIKLKTVLVNPNILPAVLGDSVGGMFTGKVNFVPVSYKFGYPFTERPEKIQFWAKYNPTGNDTAAAGVMLRKWNGSSHDTIAIGTLSIPATPSYTFYELSLNYYLDLIPDSAIIVFYPSKDTTVARLNSTLYIDDVLFTGWVGINEKTKTQNLKVYPNPAKDQITIHSSIDNSETIVLTDIAGRPFFTCPVENSAVTINTSAFCNGLYLYEVLDKRKKIVAKGKFNVIR
jgi:hypothetical protein